jgi:hypothetical protein
MMITIPSDLRSQDLGLNGKLSHITFSIALENYNFLFISMMK